MPIPLEPVIGWNTAFSRESDAVIWHPYVQHPGAPERPGPYYAISPKAARLLIRELDMALAHLEDPNFKELTVVQYKPPGDPDPRA